MTDAPSLRHPNDLQLCPFCGAPALSERNPATYIHPLWRVRCGGNACSMKPRTGDCETVAEAIAAWNKRTPASPADPISPADNMRRPNDSVEGRDAVLEEAAKVAEKQALYAKALIGEVGTPEGRDARLEAAVCLGVAAAIRALSAPSTGTTGDEAGSRRYYRDGVGNKTKI